MEVGDCVMAFGAPEGLSQSVTAGIISAKGRTTNRSDAYQNFIQTDAAINHGNSGGPLVNMRGEVIGINSAIISRTGVNEGIGLTMPSNLIRKIMGQLIDNGKVTRGFLGVIIQNVDENLAKSFKLPGTKGALISQVADNTPAAKAKLKVGDFIVAVNGKAVTNVNELRNAVAHLAPNKECPLKIYRDGKEKIVKVVLGEKPENLAAAFGGQSPGSNGPTANASRFGLKVQALDDDVRKQFGYKPTTKGVIITEVDQASDAADRGLTAGMVITAVQGKAVTSPAEFEKAISAPEAAGGIRLLVTDRAGGKRFVFISPAKVSTNGKTPKPDKGDTPEKK